MFVKSLEFVNYRNLNHDVLYPTDGINVICGENAQGKTNLLECMWLCTGGRSFRGSKENELIKFGEKFSEINMSFYSCGREQTIQIIIQNGKRKPILNDVPKNYVSQIVGSFCAVVFSPNHLSLIKNGPEERRNFVDAAICQIKPAYTSVLSRYKKILNERNALLKDIPRHRELEDTLEIWNEKLASEGSLIAAERFAYMDKLSIPAAEFYDGISKGKEKIDISYKMNSGAEKSMNTKDIELTILETLRKKQQDDIYCGYTSSGIHRDDIIVKINGKEARSFGSQGQQRSAVLSLKLAEATVLGDKKGEKPVILLDDVLSELDSSRQDYLLRKLKGMQVFISCCESNVNAKNVFTVKEGNIYISGEE